MKILNGENVTTMAISNNRRIAKNTFMLYVRMFLMLIVSLYTSRVVLDTLGVDDFGLYNVVAGVIALFSILSTSMGAATTRFLTFELGKENFSKLKKVFNAALSMHLGIAFIVFLLAETVGLWFVVNKLVIPDNRMSAALWAYQFSILSTMVSLTQVPYNALIISHEKMNVYAIVSILSAFLKLLVVYLLKLADYDKLKLYSLMQFLVILLIAFIYRFYCNRKFQESAVSFKWDKDIYRSLLSFSLWDLYTIFAGMGATQGINILLNRYFGLSVNAARGLAVGVKGNISSFGDNFMMAVKPQIIKLYADNKLKQMMKLVFDSSKFSVFLTYIIALPVLLETPLILNIWLKNVPDYTALFCRLLIIDNLIVSFRIPIITSFHAIGKIKLRNLVCGSLYLLTVVISYFCLKNGYPPESVFFATIAITILVQWAELLLLKTVIKFSVMEYFFEVIVPVLVVIFVSATVPFLLVNVLSPGFIRLLIVCVTSVVTAATSIYFIGIDAATRKVVLQKIRSQFLMFRKK